MNDPKIIGAAVTAWLAAYDQDTPDEDGNHPNLDEADIALGDVLVAQGLYRGDEGAYIESLSYEHGLVHVFIDDDCIEVNTDGTWSRFTL